MTPPEMLQLLARWRDAGWLRSLDVALARFVLETDSSASTGLLLAAALAAQLEGRGHSAFPMAALAAGPHEWLGWPAQALEEFRRAWAGAPCDTPSLRQAWGDHIAVEVDPADDAGASPLVLQNGLLYLRRYWRYERRVSAQVRARAAGRVECAAVPDRFDPSAGGALLDLLFAPGSTSNEPGHAPEQSGAEATAGLEIDWQKEACATALRSRLTIVTGGPGTGKTYTAARLLVLLHALHAGPQPLRVMLAAPTGKAASRLRQSIQSAVRTLGADAAGAVPLGDLATHPPPARTLHALLGTQPGTRRFRHDAANPLEVDVLFVDEASMVHLEMMAQLLEALPAQARLVLLGDKDQLASVEAGSVMGDLCDAPILAQQTVTLRKSHRFDGPIGLLAMAVNRGDAAEALTMLHRQARSARANAAGKGAPVALLEALDADAVLPLVLNGRAGAPGGYRSYLELVAQRPAQIAAGGAAFDGWARSVLRSFETFRVLCAVREGAWGVAGLNAAIERTLAQVGLLAVRGEWYEGRPVMVTRNDAALGVFNGDIGIVLRAPLADGGALRCWFLEGDELRSVSVGRLADVETAFAMTVHKSQGSEFGHVALVLPDKDLPVLTRELLYTGITRASDALTLVCRQPGLLAAASNRLTRRVSGLRQRLDDS